MGATPTSPLVIRSDANTLIGIGHMMRCLALAQAWKNRGGNSIFVLSAEALELEARLESEGMEVFKISAQPGSAEDAVQTTALAKKGKANWIVVDGYHFGRDYQGSIKEAGSKVLYIDDNGNADHYYADIVLNQNIHAHEGLYRNREPYTRLLLGSRYIMLQRDFLNWQKWKRDIPEVGRKVLVTLGGSDPENVTMKVIQALREGNVNHIELAIVIGPSNPHLEMIRNELSHAPFAYRLLPSVGNMPELMAWADIAVSAGGSTCWELAFMGLPNLILFFAENQRAVAEILDKEVMAVNLGYHKIVKSDKIIQTLKEILRAKEIRALMSMRGRNLVDGQGSHRVINNILLDEMTLRPVQEGDCELIWRWANDPGVRGAAFNSNPITWKEHTEWFSKKLIDPQCIQFIASGQGNAPIGQIRFDAKGKVAEIDVSVDKSYRSMGYGSYLIKMAVNRFMAMTSAEEVSAWIQSENTASIRAFEKAGFRKKNEGVFKGCHSVYMLFCKNG